MKKICIVTGSRAEYSLLRPLLNKIKSDGRFKLQVIATGMHLSPEFGYTYQEIEKDGFRIDEKVEMHLSSDTGQGITKSMGIGLIGFADAISRLKPDLVVILGDRFEIFTAAISSFVSGIPIAHIHGGELTEGAIDDAMRHSITKMSMLHFVATEEYRRRVIQLGELPERVFNVGALGVDNIKRSKLLTKERLEKELNFKFGRRNVLVTFHPVTLEKDNAESQFKEVLAALDEMEDLKAIFTMPNADTYGRSIIRLIDRYVKENPERCVSFVSLGQLRYLSTVKYMDAVVGNSSSGIVEVPSLKRPTVNIGDRQKGRAKAKSIIDCEPKRKGIRKALDKAFSREFKSFCKTVKNPYEGRDSARKIFDIVKIKINELKDLKKSFYNVHWKE